MAVENHRRANPGAGAGAGAGAGVRGAWWRPGAAGAAAQVALLAALAPGAGLGREGWLAGTGCALGGGALLTIALRRSAPAGFGPADRVTLARAVLVGAVAAMVAGAPGGGTAVRTALATVALVLDAVDGQVARRTGTASPFGARFDVEVDAFLVLVLSVQVAAGLGWWVTVIGAMRYAFVAAARVLPWLGGRLPPSRARKTVGALQGVVLVAAGAHLLPRAAEVTAVGAALALLAGSFGRDVAFLRRHRAPRLPPPRPARPQDRPRDTRCLPEPPAKTRPRPAP